MPQRHSWRWRRRMRRLCSYLLLVCFVACGSGNQIVAMALTQRSYLRGQAAFRLKKLVFFFSSPSLSSSSSSFLLPSSKHRQTTRQSPIRTPGLSESVYFLAGSIWLAIWRTRLPLPVTNALERACLLLGAFVSRAPL